MLNVVRGEKFARFFGYKLYLLLDAITSGVSGSGIATANYSRNLNDQEVIKGSLKVDRVIMTDAANNAFINLGAVLSKRHLSPATSPHQGKSKEASGLLYVQITLHPEKKVLPEWCPAIKRFFGFDNDFFGFDHLGVQGFAAITYRLLAFVTTFSVLAHVLTARGRRMLKIVWTTA